MRALRVPTEHFVRWLERQFELRVTAGLDAGLDPEAAHVCAFEAVKRLGAHALAELRLRAADAGVPAQLGPGGLCWPRVGAARRRRTDA